MRIFYGFLIFLGLGILSTTTLAIEAKGVLDRYSVIGVISGVNDIAVLKDKSANKTITVRIGDTLEASLFRVKRIERRGVEVSDGHNVFLLTSSVENNTKEFADNDSSFDETTNNDFPEEIPQEKKEPLLYTNNYFDSIKKNLSEDKTIENKPPELYRKFIEENANFIDDNSNNFSGAEEYDSMEESPSNEDDEESFETY